MIRNSYIWLPGISSGKEEMIWKQGIRDWDDFLKNEVKGISRKRKLFYNRQIIEAKKHLYDLDSSYFVDRLPSNEHWRLYDFFKEEAVFLDIETSNVSDDSYITVIGLFDGINTKVMVRNKNLDFRQLKDELARYKLIVTFNGSSFDVPYLKKKYKDLIPDIPHIDVKVMCWRLGLKGGLKEVERKLGVKRDNMIVEQMYGGDPIKLWKMYLGSGDDYYLQVLVEYNEEDCINLKQICSYCYEKLKSEKK